MDNREVQKDYEREYMDSFTNKIAFPQITHCYS